MTIRSPILLLGAAAVALSACTDPAVQTNDPNLRTKEGAVVGGLLGAVAGGIIGGDDAGERRRGALIGGLVGAGVGAGIGYNLDKQASELRAALDDRIQIVNRGDELVVIMPNDVLFDFDSAQVRPVLRADLAQLAASLQRYPASLVVVEGHTDGVGSAAYNYQLSLDRANAVKSVLVSNGVGPGRIQAIGRGEDVLPPGVAAIPQENPLRRRVEIFIRPTAG